MQSKGEFRVGIDFNPSNEDAVGQIKRMAADLIDMIEAIPMSAVTSAAEGVQQGEVFRLKALAQTAIEDGAMWAVKAATKPKPKAAD